MRHRHSPLRSAVARQVKITEQTRWTEVRCGWLADVQELPLHQGPKEHSILGCRQVVGDRPSPVMTRGRAAARPQLPRLFLGVALAGCGSFLRTSVGICVHLWFQFFALLCKIILDGLACAGRQACSSIGHVEQLAPAVWADRPLHHLACVRAAEEGAGGAAQTVARGLLILRRNGRDLCRRLCCGRGRRAECRGQQQATRKLVILAC